MSWDAELPFTKKEQEGLDGAIRFILAGLQGFTDGHELVSVTLQQTDLSDYRVILRGSDVRDAESPVRLVAFSSGSTPAAALLAAERGYRENKIRWTVDRFANDISDNGAGKARQLRIK